MLANNHSIPRGACHEASETDYETKARPSLEDQTTSNSQTKVRYVTIVAMDSVKNEKPGEEFLAGLLIY